MDWKTPAASIPIEFLWTKPVICLQTNHHRGTKTQRNQKGRPYSLASKLVHNNL